jgi:hypothetical protein
MALERVGTELGTVARYESKAEVAEAMVALALALALAWALALALAFALAAVAAAAVVVRAADAPVGACPIDLVVGDARHAESSGPRRTPLAAEAERGEGSRELREDVELRDADLTDEAEGGVEFGSLLAR